MESSIEYSLASPKKEFDNDFILNKKIIEIIKNNNNIMIGGGNVINWIVIIIGIILIGIGFFLYFNNGSWNSIDASIISISNSSNSQSNIFVKYTVNNNTYSKQIQIPSSNIPVSNTITLYYQQSNPNVVSLYNFNYTILSIILGFIGLSLIIIPNLFNSNQNSNKNYLDIYDTHVSSNGLNTVYTM